MLIPTDFLPHLLDFFDEGVYFLDAERQITHWNRGAERITGYARADVVGSACHNNILMHVSPDGASLCHSGGCPALLSIQNGVSVEVEEVFLHHKLGHRVAVKVRTAPVRGDKGEIVGAVEIFGEKQADGDLREKLRELESLAMLDPLTGAGNRRFGESRIRACLSQLERYAWPFGLLFLDIDHFKQINDTRGHEAGDQILGMVARTVSGSIRSFDNLIRWGGEEFVIVASNLDQETLEILAEKLRALVASAFVMAGADRISVTVSIGATLAKRGDTLDSLVARADHLMYRSKESGRNRVTTG